VAVRDHDTTDVSVRDWEREFSVRERVKIGKRCTASEPARAEGPRSGARPRLGTDARLQSMGSARQGE